jgi:hypothetical protein
MTKPPPRHLADYRNSNAGTSFAWPSSPQNLISRGSRQDSGQATNRVTRLTIAVYFGQALRENAGISSNPARPKELS